MRLLFRVNLGGELEAGHKGPAEGLGHATRCLALAEALRDLAPNAEIRFAFRGPASSSTLFEAAGFASERVEDEAACLQAFRPDASILDINSAGRDLVMLYRGSAPVINLAGRGLAKYYADLTFNNTAAELEAPPADALTLPAQPGAWHRGPRYALIHRRFTELRPAPGEVTSRPFSCIVCLGGVDRDNMTGMVLEALVGAPAVDFPVTAVAGPLNPRIAELQALAARRPQQVSLLVDPPDLPQRLAGAAVGIFGLGGTTDEALTLGLPSLNLGLTRFHELRGLELEAAGVIAYLGRFGAVAGESLVRALLAWRDDPAGQARRRDRALRLYDGRGCQRVARAILAYLETTRPQTRTAC